MIMPMKRPAALSRRHLKKNLGALMQKLGPIEMRPIASLKNYARNPHKHPQQQLVALAASMRQFGFTMPVLVDSNGEVIAGDARLTAAGRVGFTEIPVLVARHWSPAQVKAYRLADNRLAECATWDLSLLAAEIMDVISIDEVPIEILGWEIAAIDVMLDQEKAAQTEQGKTADPADEKVSLPPETVARTGDVWRLERHRLLCGSSLEEPSWERLMNGDKAAMSFTDPQYIIPVAAHDYGLGNDLHSEFQITSDEASHRQFVNFLTNFLVRLSAHCHDGAVIDICIEWRHIAELHEALAATGLTIVNICVWNKNKEEMGSLYRSKYELVFIAKKGSAPHRDNVKLGRHGRYRSNVWDYAGVNSFGGHPKEDLAGQPTVMPVTLVADAICDVTAHGDIVVDAFMGSGTTLLAAERTGRTGYGIEIEPSLVDVAIRRWEALTGGLAILEETEETLAEVAVRRCGEGGEEDEKGDDGEADEEPSYEAAGSRSS